MERYFRVLLAIFVSMVIIPTASAHLEFSIDDLEQTTYLGEKAEFHGIINNTRTFYKDTFTIHVLGDHMEWYQQDKLKVEVLGGKSEELNFTFYPIGTEKGEFVYEIKVTSTSDHEITESKYLILNVLRPIEFTSIDANYADSKAEIKLGVISTKNETVSIEYGIWDSDDRLVAKSVVEEEIKKGDNQIVTQINLPEQMLAGDYYVSAQNKKKALSADTYMVIRPVHDVVSMKVVESTFWYEDVVISIYNNGNVIEDYELVETVPNNDWVTGLVTEPDECNPNFDTKDCTYQIEKLNPGEITYVTYRLNFWSIYAQYGLITIIIISVIVYSFFRSARPRIVKRHVRKSKTHHTIVLEIKNPFLHHLKNVIVRDWVSPLANVVHDTNLSSPSLRRRSDAGTELIWKVGDIRPKETRILTYKIKTLIGGNLKMPRAYMRYNNKKGKRFRFFSKPLLIE